MKTAAHVGLVLFLGLALALGSARPTPPEPVPAPSFTPQQLPNLTAYTEEP
jgi:hypothetical protein